MGALSLILGDRADSGVLWNRNKKCIVEGTFLIQDRPAVMRLIDQSELDAEMELIVRREIAVNGKSRAFVNDTPVTLEQLRQLTVLVVDLHRQFDMQELRKNAFQLQVLDALSRNMPLLQQYRQVFQQLEDSQQELKKLTDQKNRFSIEYGYNLFLFEELSATDLKPQELEDLESELKLLTNAEIIKTTLSKTVNELKEGESPIVQRLKSMNNQLNNFATYHAALPALCERLLSTQIELNDIYVEIENLNDEIQHDPARIDLINQRITIGYKLLKKHNVNSTAELLDIQNQLSGKLKSVLDIDESLEKKSVEEQRLLKEAAIIASQLSDNRKKIVEPLQKNVNELLKKVGMPNAMLKVLIETIPIHEDGTDSVEFLFDANKSNRFEPIGKVASGGELSRLMLCIKSLIAESIDLPTLIFDEIDSGISGEAAKQVGLILKELALNRQVICITHQPQIAGKAASHLLVYKEIRGDQIQTSIRLLNQDERISVIAKMLSGEKPTAAAMENAREMVMN